MNMKLGSKSLISLRIKTQLLEAPACDCCRWCHPLGWWEVNGGSLEDGAEAFVLFLHGTQLICGLKS